MQKSKEDEQASKWLRGWRIPRAGEGLKIKTETFPNLHFGTLSSSRGHDTPRRRDVLRPRPPPPPPPPPPPLPHSYYSYIQVQTYICIYSRALECDPRVRENSWMCVSAFYHYRIRNEHSRSICCSRQLYNDVYNSCIANKIVLSDAN